MEYLRLHARFLGPIQGSFHQCIDIPVLARASDDSDDLHEIDLCSGNAFTILKYRTVFYYSRYPFSKY